MLSYLKNDQNQIPAASELENGPDVQTESSSEVSEYLSCAQRGKTVKQGTIVLVLLFAVGAGSIWWMIKKSSPATAQAASDESAMQIEKVLAQLSSYQTEANGQMDSVLRRFHQSSEIGQIEANELKKNPFRREVPAASEEPVEDLSQSQQAMLQDEVGRQAGRLQLWSISARDRNSCCMINDKVLYVGNEIEGFKILKIEPHRVIVGRDGFQVELKIQE